MYIEKCITEHKKNHETIEQIFFVSVAHYFIYISNCLYFLYYVRYVYQLLVAISISNSAVKVIKLWSKKLLHSRSRNVNWTVTTFSLYVTHKNELFYYIDIVFVEIKRNKHTHPHTHQTYTWMSAIDKWMLAERCACRFSTNGSLSAYIHSDFFCNCIEYSYVIGIDKKPTA